MNGCRAAQTLDLVLDLKLSAFEFEDCDVVRREVIQRIMQLIFEDFVLALQFGKMSLDRHGHLHLISLWAPECT